MAQTYVFDPVFDLSGRVVVLTGGCGLIGRALAPAFRDRGARLAIVDLSSADPAGAAARLGSDDTLGLACEVSRADAVAALVQAVVNQWGRIDVLINGHAYRSSHDPKTPAESFPEELWDAVMDVNLKGTFLLCRDVGRVMLQQGRGSIINFASTYGIVSSDPELYRDNGLGNPLAYSVSKGGVVMLTKYLGAHWASRGVRVNCVTPHGVANGHAPEFVTGFLARSPMKRLMRPEEIVGAVLFLASDASTYATGSNLLVEGGWTAW